MKHAVSALAICAAFVGGPALAADLPSGKAPPPTYYEPAPIATWTGFYVGLNAGGTFGGSDNINVTTGSLGSGFSPAYGVAGTGTGNGNFGGFIGGGQIGYNHQFSPAVVVGVEADIGEREGGEVVHQRARVGQADQRHAPVVEHEHSIGDHGGRHTTRGARAWGSEGNGQDLTAGGHVGDHGGGPAQPLEKTCRHLRLDEWRGAEMASVYLGDEREVEEARTRAARPKR